MEIASEGHTMTKLPKLKKLTLADASILVELVADASTNDRKTYHP